MQSSLEQLARGKHEQCKQTRNQHRRYRARAGRRVRGRVQVEPGNLGVELMNRRCHLRLQFPNSRPPPRPLGLIDPPILLVLLPCMSMHLLNPRDSHPVMRSGKHR